MARRRLLRQLPPGDDFEVEITQLDDTQGVPEIRRIGAQGSLWAPTDARRSPRRRLLAIALAGCVLVIVLGLATPSLPSIATSLQEVLSPFTQRADIALEGSLFFTGGVPWGAIAIDGRQLDGAAAAAGISWRSLASGPHVVTYAASPFPPLRCQVSVPPTAEDSCRMTGVWWNQTAPAGSRAVDLRATPEQLSAEDYAALVARIEAALPTATARLASGERYLNAEKDVVIATEPLRAQFHYVVNTSTDSAGDISTAGASDGEGCVSVCVAPSGSAVPGDTAHWRLIASVYPVCTYATLQGRVLVADAPTMISNESRELVPVSVTYDGDWHIAMQAG
jgi:hypothetical protein